MQKKSKEEWCHVASPASRKWLDGMLLRMRVQQSRNALACVHQSSCSRTIRNQWCWCNGPMCKILYSKGVLRKKNVRSRKFVAPPKMNQDLPFLICVGKKILTKWIKKNEQHTSPYTSTSQVSVPLETKKISIAPSFLIKYYYSQAGSFTGLWLVHMAL